MTGKTWFITGTSSGFGRQVTEQLLERGDRVAATLRRPEAIDDLVKRYDDQLWVRRLDVTDVDGIRSVVGEAFAELGRIDVVLSNAGYGVFGTAEDLADGDIDGMIEVNLNGPIQLVRAVIPHLRAQGGGRILQTSSMGGQIGYPGFSIYHAVKWGIEGFFECLAAEVGPFGIQTSLIEPGMVRTEFFESAVRTALSEPYLGNPAVDHPPVPPETMPGDQAKVAAAIIRTAESDPMPRRQLLGSDAYRLVHAALTDRLAAVETQREVALTTDYDGFTRA
ncbi:SDR family oxidoreductase [Amycolatopsis jejuensis]|uniref:SDR family oxidoreductase n=1 Tax=Amycolatopsis jejuensis TaxID=330084 RepID=UPI0005261F38|nr:SDR family oxidoreductase [Amycolatopsis jejuensis]